MSDVKTSILDLSPADIQTQLVSLGMPAYRTAQILQWIFKKRAVAFDQMTNISLPERAVLAKNYTIFTGEVLREVRAADATLKILIRWPEGGLTESVMIPAEDDRDGNDGKIMIAHRRTACLSTQVGCPVGCAFCASGLQGFKNNLSPGRIVEQALRLTALLPEKMRLTHVVFMGMGEPLANFDATLAAIRILMADWGLKIGGRKITVSTVGLPPQIRRLAEAGLPVTLAISLHAPNDELRRRIIPWARGISIKDIMAAGEYYFQSTGREITLEYIMLDGVNTLPQHAGELAAVARQLRANVNLIYYNEVPDLPFRRPSGKTMLEFQTALRSAGINTHVRRSRGRDIAAACGQLARQDREPSVATSSPHPA
ncbi:MAG: 23S rRNA (adenine(2503)-C(2))-methyltransferase RlmN [Planctomycetes bacterium]|nr:23S rRNA (adenine(2503)-C(2))-methyltransferase RlmN [Planctomycetota bacterium]